MRLTDGQIVDIREYFTRCIKGKISSLVTSLSNDGLNCIDTIVALKQENEQLQAQAARMRDILQTDKEDEFGPVNLNEVEPDKLMEGLFHNPADVAEIERLKHDYSELDDGHHKLVMAYCEQRKALRKAREALEYTNKPSDEARIDVFETLLREALAAIDKIGGVEDV
jgi:uncharacterized protein with von Willebrand factor type A (vWA) domain